MSTRQIILILFVSLGSLFLSSEIALSSSGACGARLSGQSYGAGDSSFEAGPHRVIHYPVQVQIRRLGYSTAKDFPEVKILVLGDGYSGLGLELARSGKDVQLIDLAYDGSIDLSGLNEEGLKQVSDYREHLADRMHARSATDTGFEDGRFGLVLSHLMMNNFERYQEVKDLIAETLRVLAPGGEAVFITKIVTDEIGPSHDFLLRSNMIYTHMQTMEETRKLQDVEGTIVDKKSELIDGAIITTALIAVEFTKSE